jgi:cysteine desulfurase
VIDELYFDNNATTHLAPEVRDAMCAAVNECFGNPSSEHRAGERSRRAIVFARNAVAELLGAPTESVIFGSGVTELNNWVISSLLGRNVNNQYIVSDVEHPSVLGAASVAEARGTRVTRIPVDPKGLVDLAALESAVKSPTALVSIQWVNNETGVIQPVSEIARMCANADVPFHCDAAQAAGKLAINLSSLDADFVTVSAHKMHGPAGVGAIVIRDRRKISPLLFGGSQEFGMRPGTENIIGIVGFGVAAATRNRTLSRAINRMSAFRDAFETKVSSTIPGVRINGSITDRVCNTTNMLFPNLDGSAIVALLDRQGVRCSQTSACTASRPEPSHVLMAMGLTENEAFSSVRFSFSAHNTLAEVDLAVLKLLSAIERLTGNELGASTDYGMIRHEV